MKQYTPESSSEETVITPDKMKNLFDLKEIWKYRELLYIFTWRDIKIRYRQTLLGVIYVIFQPLTSMLIFTLFFGNLAKIPSGNLPYPLFVLIGLIFWNYFSGSITRASDSMVSNESMIKKVYFPKIILPLSSMMTFLVDLSINFILLLILAFILGYPPNIWILLIFPISVLVASITIAGASLFLASLNVKYRDVRNILPFLIQIVIFLTPVIYPLTIISPRNQYIMALNPMTSVIETMRLSFQKNISVNTPLILISVFASLAIFIFGLWYFNKTEKYFADIV